MPFDRLKRREFIRLLSGAVVALPAATRAQQSERIRRIGMLVTAYTDFDAEGLANTARFAAALNGLGWIDGRSIQIEYRYAGGNVDRAKVLAAEVVRSAPELIVTNGNPASIELRRLTSIIPVVFTQVSDPVGSGLVTTLAHPGGNITGFLSFEPGMGSRWLGLLKEAAPNIRRVAVVFGSDAPATVALLRAAEAAAPALAVEVTPLDLHDDAEIERAISAFAFQPDGGVIIMPYPRAVPAHQSIIAAAARHHLPAVYPLRFFAAHGGLMFYGPDPTEQWRGAATYVDRILRGEKPADLPAQAPTKYELVLNLKSARALGLTVPDTLLARADEVIE
jgi:putative ABC transport system substrate-binding protein